MAAEKKQIIKLGGGVDSPVTLEVVPLTEDGRIDDPDFVRKAGQVVYARLAAARVCGEAGLDRLNQWHEELLAAAETPRFRPFLRLLQDSWRPEEERERQVPELLLRMCALWERVQEADAAGELQDPSDVREPMRKGIVPEQFFARYLSAVLALTVAQIWALAEEQRDEGEQKAVVDEGPSIELPSSLAAPGVRSRIMPAPGFVETIRRLCAADKDTVPMVTFIDSKDSSRGGGRFLEKKGRHGIELLHPDPIPDHLRNARAEKEALRAWVNAGVREDLLRLDETMWDVLALALAAFYANTPGDTVNTPFPLMAEDYMAWRGIDPRKRSPELRDEVFDRLRLACSDRFRAMGQEVLHIKDPVTGHKRKQSFYLDGPILVWQGDLYRNGQTRLHFDGKGRPDGVYISLGQWAKTFIEEKAMLGIFIKRLAQYDMRRQLWERRIGWYLVFNMQNQATKKKHPLFTKTILDGSGIEWKEMAEKDPGKVIRQFVGTWKDGKLLETKPGEAPALETLKRDGIISDYRCLDAPDAPDGSDLPRKGKLERWLEYRWEFTPGPELAKHLRAKQEAAKEARKAAEKLKAQRAQKAQKEKGGQP